MVSGTFNFYRYDSCGHFLCIVMKEREGIVKWTYRSYWLSPLSFISCHVALLWWTYLLCS
jgi:hypothetical protein